MKRKEKKRNVKAFIQPYKVSRPWTLSLKSIIFQAYFEEKNVILFLPACFTVCITLTVWEKMSE